MKLSPTQEQVLREIVTRYNRDVEFERTRWGEEQAQRLAECGVAVVEHPYRTLHALEKAGLLTLTHKEYTGSDLSRGSYGRWIGGKTTHLYVDTRARPTHKAQELVTGTKTNPGLLSLGQLLFHGTSDPRSSVGVVQVPGWVTNSWNVANWYAGEEPMEHPRRIDVFKLRAMPKLKLFRSEKEAVTFSRRFAYVVDLPGSALSICRHTGLDGWMIKNRFEEELGSGHDIMLCEPMKWLEHVKTKWIDPPKKMTNPADWAAVHRAEGEPRSMARIEGMLWERFAGGHTSGNYNAWATHGGRVKHVIVRTPTMRRRGIGVVEGIGPTWLDAMDDAAIQINSALKAVPRKRKGVSL